MIGKLATLLALVALVCGASAGKVSVEASSSSGQATVLVNGKPVEPGERDMDGSHINYQKRSETGGKGSCSYSSVSVSSSGDEPTNIQVQQGSGCVASDHHPGHGHRSFASHRTGFHGMGDASEGIPRHGRDVRDRRFFDVDDMINELRQRGDGIRDNDDVGGDPGSHTSSNSGTGKAGEQREVHVDRDGVHAHARTSGSGAHHETITTTTRRTSGGGVSHSVHASASSAGGQEDA